MQEDVETVWLEEGYTEALMIPSRIPTIQTKGQFDYKLTYGKRLKISLATFMESIFTTYIYFCVNARRNTV